jgi:hypothetical protein
METLLNNDFLAHYGLPPIAAVTNIHQSTNQIYFEIEDDANGEIQIHTTTGSGQAVYKNPKQYTVDIINYDKFITKLPHQLQEHKGRCDLIVCVSERYFLLNELKNRDPSGNFREGAKRQLLASLMLLMAVPTIQNYANTCAKKRACIFNKQTSAPPPINAISAFNRITTHTPNGIPLSNQFIESFGFELYEYTGGQCFVL